MGVKIKGALPPKHDFTEHLTATPAVAQVEIQKGTKDAPQVMKATQENVSAPIMLNSNEAMSIEVGGGRTVNLGNYESARISVSLRMPCSKSDLDEAYDFASEWVNNRIEKALSESE